LGFKSGQLALALCTHLQDDYTAKEPKKQNVELENCNNTAVRLGTDCSGLDGESLVLFGGPTGKDSSREVIADRSHSGSFAVLLSLLIFVFALMGMQLFANRLRFDGVSGLPVDISDPRYADADVPRSNFDDFMWSLVTVFQVLSGENWNTVLYDCWKTSKAAPVYFVSLVVLGIFCALNLFLALLLKQFDGSELVTGRIHPEEEEISRRVADKVQNHDGPGLERRIALALDNPLNDPSSNLAKTLLILNLIFTAIFLAEFCIRVVAKGLKGYFSDGWNMLDFATVVASILELCRIEGGKSLRVFRVLRVLRPLRMINRFKEVKLVVDALINSLPAVVDVGVVCALVFFVFSIFGVTFLKGTFYYCRSLDAGDSALSPGQLDLITYPSMYGQLKSNERAWLNLDAPGCDGSNWSATYLPTSREICECTDEGAWAQSSPIDFDNVIHGLALLFEISTTESWTDVMSVAIDQRGVDMQPVPNNNRAWAVYFIAFLLVVFVLALDVAAADPLLIGFRQGLLTEAQMQWARTQQFVLQIKPEKLLCRPKNTARALCFDVVLNKWFDRAIAVVILANSACLASVSFGDSLEKMAVLDLLNGVFSSVFILECVLKTTAFGGLYFRSGWNNLDFVIVIGLLGGFVLRAAVDDTRLAATVSSVASFFRIARLLRLVRLVRNLRVPFNTLVAVLPGIANMGSLLLLILFVYSVCGVQLYGTVALQGLVNDQANFRSVGNAMLLLLRFATGEGWNGFMHDLMVPREDCEDDSTHGRDQPWCLDDQDYPDCQEVNGCAAGSSAYAYFYSFTAIVSFVMLNMVVGIVLTGFEVSSESELLASPDLEKFTRTWAIFDPQATWFIDASRLPAFLSKLPPPWEDSECERSLGTYTCDDDLAEISVTAAKKVHIVDVASLLAKRLVRRRLRHEFQDIDGDHPVREILKRKTSFSDKTTTLGKLYADEAAVILRAVHRFRRSRALGRSKAVFPRHDPRDGALST
ncbi:hypothetical protein THAOC_04757, partial [Thalassiosira oceanica]